MLRGVTPVQCGSCTACCYGERIELLAHEGDDPALYPGATPGMSQVRQGAITWFLPELVDGHCAFLVDGKCSVYHYRPFLCRDFSCVEMIRQTPPETVEARVRAGLVQPEVVARGRELIRRGHP